MTKNEFISASMLSHVGKIVVRAREIGFITPEEEEILSLTLIKKHQSNDIKLEKVLKLPNTSFMVELNRVLK